METVAKVKSLTGSDWYTVTYTPKTRKFGCSCPSNIYRRDAGDCKHITELKDGTYPFAKVRLTDFGTNLITKVLWKRKPKAAKPRIVKPVTFIGKNGVGWYIAQPHSSSPYLEDENMYMYGLAMTATETNAKTFATQKDAEEAVQLFNRLRDRVGHGCGVNYKFSVAPAPVL